MIASPGSDKPSSAASSSSTTRKVPLPPNRTTHSSGSEKRRTSHACDRCRLMRAKCSGGARCSRCLKDNTDCMYGDHKRERNRKDLADNIARVNTLEEDNRNLVSALRQLAATQASELGGLSISPGIAQLLSKYAGDEPQSDSVPSQSRSNRSISSNLDVEGTPWTDHDSEVGGEGRVPSSIGSPGRQGEIMHLPDSNFGPDLVGFIGKMSEVSWIQRCREHLISRLKSSHDTLEIDIDPRLTAISGLHYFKDDCNLLTIDEDYLDGLRWPPFHVAVILSEAHFYAFKGAYQFVSHDEFMSRMLSYPHQNPMPSGPDLTWLALANLVWAVSAKWLQLAGLDNFNMIESHLVYYARARALGLDHRVVFETPKVEQVQGSGLLALYLLMNGSVTRAWNTAGNAILNAMALGLHLKVSDPSVNRYERERRAQTWFSLYKLQVLLSEITGRPQLIRSAHVTVPFDLLENTSPFRVGINEDVTMHKYRSDAHKMWSDFLQSSANLQTNSFDGRIKQHDLISPGSYLFNPAILHRIHLCHISEQVADQLYTGRQELPWSETQKKIEQLQHTLEGWLKSLPEDLRVDQFSDAESCSFAQIDLTMRFRSLSMVLHRPCLCEIVIEDESVKSKEFNRTSAQLCINGAMLMLEFLPNDVERYRIFQLLPWWGMLHYICQAAAVLLLELCLDVQHLPNEAQRMAKLLQKAMSYLRQMAHDSMSAYKAWRVFRHLLSEFSERTGELDAFEMMEEPRMPNDWTPGDENSLIAVLT